MTDGFVDAAAYRAEIARLNKIIQALMNRAERGAGAQGSDFNLFQSTVMLEEQVRRRTEALEAALRENKLINRALRESEAKFRGLVNQPLVGIALIEDGKFSFTNSKFDEIFGYSADEMRQLTPLDLAAVSDRPLIAEQLRRRLNREVDHVDYTLRGRRKDGAAVDVEIHGGLMDIDGTVVLISVALDITERTRIEREVHSLQQEFRDQANHDALTGLYNRHFLESNLRRELILAKRHDHHVGVVMADLDHFKRVNDDYGHQAGDEVLRFFGDLIKHHCRGSDIYCRYGGEEFLLILPGMTEQSTLERAEQLRRAMAGTTVKFAAVDIAITASFGVAVFPKDGHSGEELIAAADKALYAAKAAGRNQVMGSSAPAAVRALVVRPAPVDAL
jgi:diguanylate cyclase (GGDEF)-like protein/PAS domain S-box-containing protein